MYKQEVKQKSRGTNICPPKTAIESEDLILHNIHTRLYKMYRTNLYLLAGIFTGIYVK